MLKQLLTYSLLLSAFICTSQSAFTFCDQVSALKSLIEKRHYKPKPINDSLSKGVFNLFLERLDDDKDYFLQTDIALLKTNELKLDDFIQSNNCEFINQYISILENRIARSKLILQGFNTEALDYSGAITLQYIPNDNYTFYKDEADLKNGLKKRVSYKVIAKLLDEKENIETIKANFNTFETEAKSKIIQSELCRLEEFLNKDGGIKRFVEEAFLNAFLQYQDPNSSFFNGTEKITYENHLAAEQLSFGVVTDKNKDGDIVIAHIVPGSAAFKNGNLEKDDILVSLTANNNTLEILCVSNEEIVAFLNTEANKTVIFSIKKKNGTLQKITLTRTKIKTEDNAIRGYLIGENANFGYIKIPSFYTNSESVNGRGLTADIAKELYKLQKSNIQGLVLDLRFNGGGSMQEAIELSGMFIDRGPVSIIKANTDDTFTIRDPKRGSFFTKPLVVLLNNYSASASEFFACAMQDYNRAIIVGSKTHGKSSAQRIMPLSENKSLGFCKITVEAFYRVTGKSHQSVGVIPDIILPSLYDNFKSNEEFRPFSLKNDTVSVVLKHRALSKLNIETTVKNSHERVNNESNFITIASNNKKLIKRLFTEGERYPLSIESISKNRKERYKLMESIFTEVETDSTLLPIKNTKATNELLAYNLDEKEQNDDIIKMLSNDVYINEAKNILIDFINTNK